MHTLVVGLNYKTAPVEIRESGRLILNAIVYRMQCKRFKKQKEYFGKCNCLDV